MQVNNLQNNGYTDYKIADQALSPDDFIKKLFSILSQC